MLGIALRHTQRRRKKQVRRCAGIDRASWSPSAISSNWWVHVSHGSIISQGPCPSRLPVYHRQGCSRYYFTDIYSYAYIFWWFCSELRNQLTCSGFVISTCHSDILDFLKPDWIFLTGPRQFFVSRDRKHPVAKVASSSAFQLPLSRTSSVVTVDFETPILNISIRLIEDRKKAIVIWEQHFKQHHYLSSTLARYNLVSSVHVHLQLISIYSHGFCIRGATSFLILWDKVVVGLVSFIPFPHAIIKPARREHRTVILPEYQGNLHNSHVISCNSH